MTVNCVLYMCDVKINKTKDYKIYDQRKALMKTLRDVFVKYAIITTIELPPSKKVTLGC